MRPVGINPSACWLHRYLCTKKYKKVRFFLSDKTFRERYEIASFSTLTMVEQYRLLEDANSVVASAMAKNPILLDDLQELALTKETAVRGSLASNPWNYSSSR